MNILITGANGFIGRALCDKLLTDGHQVRGAVRGERRGKTGDRRLGDGFQVFVTGEIDERTDWGEALDGIDVVVHLAARVHVMDDLADDPLAEFRKVNTAGTLNLARQAVAAGVKRFVFLSTIKVNGEGTGKREDGGGRRETGRKRDERPTSNIECPTSNEKQKKQKAEGRFDPYTEMDKPEPEDAYAVSKWEAEQGLMAIGDRRREDGGRETGDGRREDGEWRW